MLAAATLGVSAASGASSLCSACGLAISGLLRQGLTTDVRRASMREIVPRSSDELRLAIAMTVGKSEDTLWRRRLPRWSGVAAILGGLMCVLAAFLHSLEPTGCIGLDCETREMRSATDIVPALTPTAALLVLIGIAGLTLMARQSARFKKLADSGLISAAAGLALLFLGALIQAAFFNGDFPWMPLFVIPGLLGVIVGFVLIGIFVSSLLSAPPMAWRFPRREQRGSPCGQRADCDCPAGNTLRAGSGDRGLLHVERG